MNFNEFRLQHVLPKKPSNVLARYLLQVCSFRFALLIFADDGLVQSAFFAADFDCENILCTSPISRKTLSWIYYFCC